jgi:hypothetical protein
MFGYPRLVLVYVFVIPKILGNTGHNSYYWFYVSNARYYIKHAINKNKDSQTASDSTVEYRVLDTQTF